MIIQCKLVIATRDLPCCLHCYLYFLVVLLHVCSFTENVVLFLNSSALIKKEEQVIFFKKILAFYESVFGNETRTNKQIWT